MSTISFLGRIFPESHHVSFADIPTLDWKWSQENLTIRFAVQIDRSKVKVNCELENYKPEYLPELHKRAFDMARVCMNLIAFATTYGLSLIFEKIVHPDGSITDIHLVGSPELRANCTVIKNKPETDEERRAMGQVMGIVMREPAMFMLLNDLTECLSIPHMIPLNCGRVIDGLRKLVAPGEPKSSWPIFRDTMHVDEPYVIYISEYSKNPRHGDHKYVDGPTTVEILNRTWAIMNRFLEYRKGGNQPLSFADFPILKGRFTTSDGLVPP